MESNKPSNCETKLYKNICYCFLCFYDDTQNKSTTQNTRTTNKEA